MSVRKYRRRLPHIHIPGHAYFLTFCLSSRQADLLSPEERTLVVSHIQRVSAGKVNAFVVMPDHVHLIYTSAVDEDLRKTLKGLKGASSHSLVSRHSRVAPVWQEETFDRLIRDERELTETWKYIQMNPVRRGLVGRPEEYQWTGWQE